jgi:hypothetical protein
VTKPQQNELRRSGKGATDSDSAKTKARLGTPGASGNTGPVPPANRTKDDPETFRGR